ncbi:MAG TPA: efflux RND transporter periplasmic adaptor subunit, partial [Rhodopila sp.]|nr:efflux RND transporter periplasmic adaptor subunit [Rhodopila sp.]
MRFQGFPRLQATRYLAGGVAAAGAVAACAWFAGSAWQRVVPPAQAATAATAPAGQANTASGGAGSVSPAIDLTATQLQSFKIAPVGTHVFPVQLPAVGSIDFNEDMETQVFTNYQGRIVSLYAKVGDDVVKGQKLFTIDSPDLVQAESTLISTAGVLRLTTRALDRAKDLYSVKGLAQKDYDQAVSDQQGAEGNYHAAIDAVRMFGKTQADIDRIVASKTIDPILVVSSPINGRVTVRNAAPGLFVQPGNTPAPFTVADISTKWMLANVPEGETAAIRSGQEVRVSVMAYPNKVFEGTITTVAATVDPTVHTLLVRSQVSDPEHLLLPGMFANFVIETGAPVTATAMPEDGVVREGDGTMTVWVTGDHRKFTQRAVTLGLRNDGYDQIVDGLKQGEMAVTDGAIFLDNML